MNSRTIVNIGVQNFDKLRERDSFYIDKTGFIREWWEGGAEVTLITRPRRFGKTLNMSMLECFFSTKYAGRGDLFEGLDIWKDERYRQLQGTYPVIFLSFAGIKAVNADDMKYKMTEVISNLYDENTYLLEGDTLTSNEKEYYQSIKPGVDDKIIAGTVQRMARFLSRYYGKKAIILLDEYDTPMQEAWLGGYWDETVAFFRSFFDYTFKTDPHMHRGVITGITRISKESIFSDLNNLNVITTTSDRYAISFGFTEQEVFRALDDTGLGNEKQQVKQWYDGFTFGKYTDIYNPWSITSFIDEKKYKAYWANTSANSLVNSLIRTGRNEVKETMETLLQGGSFTAIIDEQIVFSQLGGSVSAIWSLLLATGYLKVLGTEIVGEDKTEIYTLALTNKEVEIMFKNMVNGWFKDNASIPYNDFVKAMLDDDVESVNDFMNDIALDSFSNFDTAKGTSSGDIPERFYHGFVLGLMVDLAGRYVIKSIRESGFGRYDILMKPTDRDRDYAYIIEFKVHKPRKEKDLEETLANAHRQIEERKYETDLAAEGFAPERIRKYGFAFRGKECLIG